MAVLSVNIEGHDAASSVLRGVASEIEGAGKKAEEAEGRFGKLHESLADVAKVGAGLVAGNVLQGLTAGLGEQFGDIVGQTSAWGEEVRVLSQNLGVTSENASTLALAMKDLNIAPEEGEKSFAKFAKGLQGVEDQMDGAIPGAKTTLETMKDLGITVDDATGKQRPFMDILGDVADTFKDMPDGVEKTARAQALFGRSGMDMIPMLNLGKEGLAEVAGEAEKYGLQLTGENVQQIRQFALAHNEMNAAVEGARLQLGVMFIPLLTSLTSGLTQAVVAVRGIVTPLLDMAKAFVASDPNSFALGLEKLLGPLGVSLPLVQQFTNGLFGVVNAIKQMVGGDVQGGFDQLMAHLKDLGTEIAGELKQWALAFLSWIEPMIPPLLEQLGQMALRVIGFIFEAEKQYIGHLIQWAAAFIAWVEPMVPQLLDKLTVFAGQLGDWILARAPDFVTDLVQWVAAFLGWILPMIPPLLVKLAGVLFEIGKWMLTVAVPGLIDFGTKLGLALIQGLLKGLEDLAPQLQQMLMDQLAKVHVDLGPFHLSAAGFSIDAGSAGGVGAVHVPGFAGGTDYAPGGVALVGEQGPELVSLPRGSSVAPAGSTVGGLGRLADAIAALAAQPVVLQVDGRELARATRSNLLQIGASLTGLGLG